jgi:hypothetical protein
VNKQCKSLIISHNVISWTIDQTARNLTFLDDPTDKVVTDVDVLSAGVGLMIACQSDRGLVIGEECHSVELCDDI